MIKTIKNLKAFSLIELLASISMLTVIGFSASISYPEIKGRVYDMRTKVEMRNLRTAMIAEAARPDATTYFWQYLTGPSSFNAPYQAARISDGISMYAYRRNYTYSWSGNSYNYSIVYQYGWHRNGQYRYLYYDYNYNGNQYTYEYKWPL